MKEHEEVSPRPHPTTAAQGRLDDAPTFELRIHGIGDHDYLSSLGSPELLAGRSEMEPDTVGRPILPTHGLRLLSWSGMSRAHAKLLWFLALPFTLVNVAGYMGDKRPGGRTALPVLVGAVFVTGIVVTVSAQLWAVALLETITRATAVEGSDFVSWLAANVPVTWSEEGRVLTNGRIVARLSALVATVLFAILLAARLPLVARGDRTEAPATLSLLTLVHLVAVCAMGYVLVVHPPTEWQPPEETSTVAWLTAPVTEVLYVWRPTSQMQRDRIINEVRRRSYTDMPTSEEAEVCRLAEIKADLVERRLDPMNAMLLASVALVSLLALLLLACSAGFFAIGNPAGPTYAMSAFALVASVTILHAFWSSVRLAIDWVVVYLDNWGSLDAVVDRWRGVSLWDRLLLGYQFPGPCQLNSLFLDDFATFGALGLFSLIAAGLVVNGLVRMRTSVLFSKRRSVGRQRAVHQLVCDLGTAALPATLLLSAILWVGLSLAIIFGRRNWFLADDIARTVAHALAAGSLGYLLFNGRIGFLRQAISRIADVLGFWPASWHVCSGKSYRPSLIAGIDHELRRKPVEKAVLVGHSQGSVLLAWYVAKKHDRQRRISLITCGSPLQSLYATFFPAHFDDEVFKAIRAVPWINLWRDTDPISTEIQQQDGRPLNEKLTDSEMQKRGHSDYWIDPVQVRITKEQIEIPAASGGGSEGSDRKT